MPSDDVLREIEKWESGATCAPACPEFHEACNSARALARIAREQHERAAKGWITLKEPTLYEAVEAHLQNWPCLTSPSTWAAVMTAFNREKAAREKEGR